ncbi:2-hydroxyacid dehydrogenase [Chelatococcus sp. GCM10030263]|uniref:2-hydroxyacid dehydrogenase n=1 Tax=Chelatococcus sp. GCM10030263 TaxID=3273387 RepID=UPI00360A32F5
MPKPLVVITSRYSDALVAKLERHASVMQGADQLKGMPRCEILGLMGDCVGLITQAELKIDEELIAHAPKLRVVANATAGFDNMDIAAMRARRIWGTNCPDSFSADTASHAIGLMLALTRNILAADRYVRSGQWKRDGWMPGGRWDGVALPGKIMGIVGLGHIGREVARRAEAFGMTVRHFSRSGEGTPGYLPLDELLAVSDVVSLHCPLNAETRHLIDVRALARMKKSAILINVSRGAVVKIDDLVDALGRGEIAGAGLDVFEFEPEVPEALFSMGNVVLSPHMGGCTAEARQSAWELSVDNVIAVLRGEPPKTPAFAL